MGHDASREARRSAISDVTLLDQPVDLSEARAQAKDVREQLRSFVQTLARLASEAPEIPPAGVERLTRARLNVAHAIQELDCTDTAQGPF